MSSQLGSYDCDNNITISSTVNVVHAIPGTLCVECIFDNKVATDAEFEIQRRGSAIDLTKIGEVIDGVLVVFDAESLLLEGHKRIHCMSVALNATHSVLVVLTSKSYYTQNGPSMM